MRPKPTATCPACLEQVRAFIINQGVVRAGRGEDDNPKRRCIDCWNHGREPGWTNGKTQLAGANASGASESHSAGAGAAFASAPLPVAGSGA